MCRYGECMAIENEGLNDPNLQALPVYRITLGLSSFKRDNYLSWIS